MKRDALISACGLYRNLLFRQWDATLPIFLIIGLNPSRADALVDDPTCVRGIGFAKREGCGSLIMENVANYRATSPREMLGATCPATSYNLKWVYRSAVYAKRSGGKIVCAWGTNGSHRGLDRAVYNALHKDFDLYCFGVTKDGHPKHPLYLRADTPLEPFKLAGAMNQ